MIELEVFKNELERLAAQCRETTKQIQNLLDSLESKDDLRWKSDASAWDFDESSDRVNDKYED